MKAAATKAILFKVNFFMAKPPLVLGAGCPFANLVRDLPELLGTGLSGASGLIFEGTSL
jgi:hypothetical protein